jgi:hypothetical protein
MYTTQSGYQILQDFEVPTCDEKQRHEFPQYAVFNVKIFPTALSHKH